ncbi:hypothetical protein O7635_12720 [Asanoa sp. WMMD1127]|uniref:hypothetical protein n=1 Tax=Asanoa sp. WMMD1127 TaxID=3016107 RepID=UPI002417CE75|nr:hypothetical protein [Asanoa sp. WMMD1127]MDG4822714.1 hypothetical protein [Asanoa sp. WMMD1127]
MRRILVAAVAVSALALAACGSSDDDAGGAGAAPAGASPTAAAAAGGSDDTTVCREAVQISKDGAAGFGAGVENLLKLAIEGDEAKVDAAEKEFRGTLGAWSDKLAELSGKQVSAEVKSALTEGAATVEKIADPADNTPVNAAKEALTGVADKVRAACS